MLTQVCPFVLSGITLLGFPTRSSPFVCQISAECILSCRCKQPPRQSACWCLLGYSDRPTLLPHVATQGVENNTSGEADKWHSVPSLIGYEYISSRTDMWICIVSGFFSMLPDWDLSMYLNLQTIPHRFRGWHAQISRQTQSNRWKRLRLPEKHTYTGTAGISCSLRWRHRLNPSRVIWGPQSKLPQWGCRDHTHTHIHTHMHTHY